MKDPFYRELTEDEAADPWIGQFIIHFVTGQSVWADIIQHSSGSNSDVILFDRNGHIYNIRNVTYMARQGG